MIEYYDKPHFFENPVFALFDLKISAFPKSF
jgi:hypothetical protein